jgi:LacI family transcriptional regulator
VPERLAVLGVDDDPVLCEFAQPQLSSIVRDDERAGLMAATLLQRLMEARRHGLPAPTDRLRLTVPPLGVTERRSTATYACRHPLVEELVGRIQASLGRPATIDELVRDLPLARRRLEYLFRQELGMPIYQFLLRLRVRRARELIAGNDGRLTLTAIARECGFSSLRHLRLALRRIPEAAQVEERGPLSSGRRASQPTR